MGRLNKPIHSFYDPSFEGKSGVISDEEFHHCIQVLRHKEGDTIKVLNGKGIIGTVRIVEVTKKVLTYEVMAKEELPKKSFSVHLFIAPTKNMDRMEWMVEKLGEIHIDAITFIKTENSERTKLRMDRLDRKLISAMKQSKSGWKTQLHNLVDFDEILSNLDDHTIIAHLADDARHICDSVSPNEPYKILIGPEGDFSSEEVHSTLQYDVKPVSLGKATLRTETAGIFACQAINMVNRY